MAETSNEKKTSARAKAAEREERDARKEAFDREIEDEMRREQIEKIWKNYGNYILAVAALIVIGVGGWKFWENRQIAAANAAGARFEAATQLAESAKTDEALKAFAAIATDKHKAYSVLARLRLAGAEAKAGRTAEAIAAYEEAAKATHVDPLIAEFAQLQIATLKIDTADWTELQNRLTPLMGEKGPWRYSARELFGLAAWKAGKTEEARATFEQLLGDRKSPPSVGERSRIIMDVIVATELAKPAALTPAPAATETKSEAAAPAVPPKKK